MVLRPVEWYQSLRVKNHVLVVKKLNLAYVLSTSVLSYKLFGLKLILRLTYKHLHLFLNNSIVEV